MKFKQVFKTVLPLCGVLLAFIGVGCVFIGSFVDHDTQLKKVRDSQGHGRSYGTQYWLGLPLVGYGILLMNLGITQRREKLIPVSLFISIPMIVAAFVAAILHGISFVYFVTTARGEYEHDEGTLLTFHAAIFGLAATTFGIIFGIVIISVVSLLQMFYIQLPVQTTSVDNQRFVDGQIHGQGISRDSNLVPSQRQTRPLDRGIRRATTTVSSTIRGRPAADYIHPSRRAEPISDELPPSYESLVNTFAVTNGTNSERNTSSGNARSGSHGNPVATVHYAGETNSISDRFHSARGQQIQTTLQEIQEIQEINEITNSITATTGGTDDISDQRSENASDSATGSQDESSVVNEDRITTCDNNGYAGLQVHRPLEARWSDSSDIGIYVDIFQNTRDRETGSHAAVRYRGQLDTNSGNFVQMLSGTARESQASETQDSDSHDTAHVNTENDIEVQVLPQETPSNGCDSASALAREEERLPCEEDQIQREYVNTRVFQPRDLTDVVVSDTAESSSGMNNPSRNDGTVHRPNSLLLQLPGNTRRPAEQVDRGERKSRSEGRSSDTVGTVREPSPPIQEISLDTIDI